MSSYSSHLEHLIGELGGCGLMQKLLCIIIYFSSTVTYWSTLAMAFIGYDPGFKCHTLDVQFSSLSTLNLSDLSNDRLCSAGPNTSCINYIFPNNLRTAVTEWNLVCEKRWIVAFITSVQMVGFLVGSLIAGQMADTIGRKTTMLTGIATLVLFNFAAFFAQSWKVYSAIRFAIGTGVGLYNTVKLTLMMEFVPAIWRPIVVSFPSMSFIAMLFALVSWWLHDWRRLHLLKTVIGIFFLMIMCLVPESFRWLVSKMKFERAERTIEFVANVNRVNKPELKDIFDKAAIEINASRHTTTVYTIATLWTSKELRSVTMSLFPLCSYLKDPERKNSFESDDTGFFRKAMRLFNTIRKTLFAIVTTWYSMALGMESISTDIYLTMFLINLVDVPASSVTGPLINRFGRRNYCLFIFGLCGILSCVSGVLQHFDKLSKNSTSLNVATLVISFLAKMTATSADTSLVIYTTEVYPTVVRTIGYGFQATVGRFGAVVAPLLVYLDGLFPGSMYFTCGLLIFLSSGCILRLKETKNVVLQDSI